ncbi:MAG TPA: FAD-dependent oxidoreductase [Myxococcota bacterium]
MADVVVVGAGFAGLAAAARLAAAGLAVRVLERAARAGGRATVASLAGQPVDPSAARVSTGDAALLALLRETGLAAQALPLRPWVSAQLLPDGGCFAPVDDGEPWRVARTPGVRVLHALRLLRLPRLLARYAPHLDVAYAERAAPLDDRSLRDFGELYFGRSVVERWMEPWLAERAPVDERETSRAAFLLRWWSERAAHPGALREPPGLLAELLAARSAVRLGSGVAAVEPRAGGGLAVALESGETLAAGAVVLAVPAAEALRVGAPLWSRAERDALGAVRCDPALAWVAHVRPLPVSAATRVRVPRAAGSPLSLLALEPLAARDAAGVGRGRLTALARGPLAEALAGAPDDVAGKQLADAAARCLPGGFDPDGDAIVCRFPAAWPRFEVGAFRRLARLRAVLADRRAAGRPLYLAGDWLAAPTLEGAVASGRRAAEELLAERRRRVSAA